MRAWASAWAGCTVYIEGDTNSWDGLPVVKKDDFSHTLSEAEWLIVGTGWSAISQRAIREGKLRGIPVFAVLDHWTNYEARFTELTSRTLPDAVIVTDDWAENGAKQRLPWATTIQWPNFLLAELRRKISKFKYEKEGGIAHVLLLGEPTRKSYHTVDGQPERVLLDCLPDHLATLDLDLDKTRLSLRLHPTEEGHKYRDLIRASGLNIQVHSANEMDVLTALAKSSMVLGLTSYALFLSWASNQSAFSLSNVAGITNTLPLNTVPQLVLV